MPLERKARVAEKERALKAEMALRADLAAGVRSLDEGRGKELNIEDVIARARERHCQA